MYLLQIIGYSLLTNGNSTCFKSQKEQKSNNNLITILPSHFYIKHFVNSRQPPGRILPLGHCLTLGVAFSVLSDHTRAILLVCWPLVDVHGCVGGACIQDYPILGRGLERTEERKVKDRGEKIEKNG